MNTKKFDQEQSESLEPKSKRIIAQCCAASGPNLLFLAYGMGAGYLTVLIPELYREDTEIVVTTDELTWISSINYFVVPLGALVAGPSLDRVGRKAMMYLATVSFLLSWVLLYFWATSAWTLMLAFALLGFASGVADPSSHTYISEIAEVRYRGTMLTMLSLLINLGFFLQLLMGNYLHWRTCALVDAAVTIMAFIAILFVPESPQWLAKQGRLPETKRSLQWLRGWADVDSVKLEFESLVESSSKTSKRVLSCTSIEQSLFRREVLVPFFILAFTFFISRFNGTGSLATYLVLVFEKIETPIKEYDAVIITGALQVLAMSILILSIRRTGKRLPTLCSLLVSGFALLGVSVYAYLREQSIIQQDSSHSWIPMTLVLLAIFTCAGGIHCSTWIVASELFPVEVKGFSMSILGSICSIYNALANKSFLYMLDGMTLPGTFAFFAVINFLGLIVLYRVMPETEGKSLAEIEKFYQKNSKMYNVED